MGFEPTNLAANAVPRVPLGSLAQQAPATPASNAALPIANSADATPAPLPGVSPQAANWQPAQPTDVQPVADARQVAPAALSPITNAVNAVFAKPVLPPPPAPVAPARAPQNPVFVAESAQPNGDGSLLPPPGRPQANAPAPGVGRVAPPGLKAGNSVLRYGADGKPANMPILAQGDTNGCGTTSLSMVLDYLAGGKQVFDRPKIDAAIRHYDMFTSPGDALAFAERQGLQGAIHTHTTPADLRRMIDQGLPVQILMDVNDAHNGKGLHYEVITGYGTDAGGRRYFELANPWGMREYMPEATLLAHWSNLTAAGVPLGVDRVALVFKPANGPQQLLSDERHAFANTGITGLRVARGLTQVTTGWARRDYTTVAVGAFRLLFGGLVAIPALLGTNVANGSTRLIQRGTDLIRGGHVGGGALDLAIGAVGWAAAAPFRLAGNLLSGVVDLAADGLQSARLLFA